MFAVRNNSTGKFLKAFNGSFNRASFRVHCDIASELIGNKNVNSIVDKLKEVSWDKVVERMWCLDTPDGAQLYKKKSAVIVSIGDEHEHWIEIVPVISAEKKDGFLNLNLSKEQTETLQEFLSFSEIICYEDINKVKILSDLHDQIQIKKKST